MCLGPRQLIVGIRVGIGGKVLYFIERQQTRISPESQLQGDFEES